jgi:uncharacterized protein (DUF427 family)
MKRIEPDAGQESVWDYPRPPRVEDCGKLIQVCFKGAIIAETRRAKRVLETSHPPVYYLPREDVAMQYLETAPRRTHCEFKGAARYFDVGVGDARVGAAAWTYEKPAPGYEELREHIAFYPSLMEICLVDGEVVDSQEGDFYGGWITRDIVGPFKGEPGTRG